MVERDPQGDNVIRFPLWRRTAGGAPGAGGSDREMSPDSWNPSGPWEGEALRHMRGPRAEEVDGLDRPVWHEGAAATSDVLVTFRVDILGTTPPIWRRLICGGSLTLDRLHPVLAAAFRWSRDAEYRFRDVVRRERSTRVGTTFRNQWTARRAPDSPEEWTVPLVRVLDEPRARMRYDYGPHFAWRCTIVAEDVMPMPPVAAGAVPVVGCIGGRRAGPPADLGSAAVYGIALDRQRSDAPPWSEVLSPGRHVRAALAYPRPDDPGPPPDA
ncbi:IS1096 element passenger TnpR family protein [Mobilicoccus massiliensis]|uniref:IS1096 element passenger TnpR family protein n=1 Tax=Mobilicoccus massiliensis TaxID=1522310 RepID=UPI000590AF49|nr:plasmid pRiA4b ORF-3 family protein [Mobilicoccus massiliensis]